MNNISTILVKSKNLLVNNMPKNIKSLANNLSFAVKEHSSEIMFAGGIISMGASLVSMYNSSLKINEIVEHAQDSLNLIESAENGDDAFGQNLTEEEQYTSEDARSDRLKVYTQACVDGVKTLAVPMGLATVSMLCFTKSNNILRDKNIALAGAYATLNDMYKKYRANVVERYGEEVDNNLRYSVTVNEKTETTTTKSGKEKTITKKVPEANIQNKDHEYARLFDEINAPYFWTKDGRKNLMKIRAQEAYLNDLLHSRAYTDIHGYYHPGILYLNEAYRALGLEESQAGSVVGWLYYGPNHENEREISGDNYVSISILDKVEAATVEDMNFNSDNYHSERNFFLDFNIDGAISSVAYNRLY